MNPKPRPCFNVQLLGELRSYIDSIIDTGGQMLHMGQTYQINYGVLASKAPGVFNLGGDLLMFRAAIASHDRNQLIEYGTSCIDNLFPGTAL